MRFLGLMLFLLSLAPQVFASINLRGTIEQVWCGELDPFFGDTCLVFVKTFDQKKVTLVLDFDAWPFHDPDKEGLIGAPLSVTQCQSITDEDSLRSLKNFDDQYTYLDCLADLVSMDLKDSV